MISRQMPTRGDLILLGVSAASIIAEVLLSTLAVDVIAGLLLTLYLPGAALVSAIGRQRLQARVVERHVWIVGASIGLTVLGGLVLDFAGGLNRSSWLVWTGAVILVCIALKQVPSQGLRRTDTDPATPCADESDATDSHEETIGEPADQGDRTGSIRVSLRQAVLLIGAGVICAAALILSIHTNAASTRESFVQAWVLPRPSESVSSTSVQLGLRNHLGSRRTFLVHVNIGKGTTKLFSVTLADGASWTQVINRQPGERVETTVSTSSQPSVVLSRVYLATPLS